MNHWETLVRTDPPDKKGTYTRMPDGATSLVFCVLPGDVSHLVVLGPRTRASYYTAKNALLQVTVRFRHGSARLLTGIPLNEIAGRIVPLSDLWGSSAVRLHDELREDLVQAPQRIDQALRERFGTRPERTAPTGALVCAATAMLDGERVQDTARKLSVSERHLRNLFTDMVGLSPKQFARVNRVRTVISRARRERGALLATGVGYYDQSHMGAEFRAAMGVPLGAYMAGRLPVTDC